MTDYYETAAVHWVTEAQSSRHDPEYARLLIAEGQVWATLSLAAAIDRLAESR